MGGAGVWKDSLEPVCCIGSARSSLKILVGPFYMRLATDLEEYGGRGLPPLPRFRWLIGLLEGYI